MDPYYHVPYTWIWTLCNIVFVLRGRDDIISSSLELKWAFLTTICPLSVYLMVIFFLLKDLDSFAQTCLFLVAVVNVSNVIYRPLSFFCSFKMQWNYGFSAASISSSLISFFISVGGHDSQEDAISCMELMHWRIKEDARKEPRSSWFLWCQIVLKSAQGVSAGIHTSKRSESREWIAVN